MQRHAIRSDGLVPRLWHAWLDQVNRSVVCGDQLIYGNGVAPPAKAADAAVVDGRRDFDFYYGRWQVRNERLRERLRGSDEWETFEAMQECHPILGGLGNLDDFVTDWSDGFRGMTLRLFNPQTQQWNIYWAGNRSGVLEPPVVGRFDDGVGVFFGDDQHQGQPVRVRFLWSDITARSAHWQQAFSIDDGRSWETNWHMYMTRCGD
jgi:hypothetical protein